MKQLLFIFFLLLSLQVSLNANNHLIRYEEEYVSIKSETETAERERFLTSVECYLNRESDIITLEYAGIGIPVVYIYDFSGNVCSCQYGIADFGMIVLDLPSVEGVYQIIVESIVYRGTGKFLVY